MGRRLGQFLALYAAILISVSLSLPRRFYRPGERRCFDDWCVTAEYAQPAGGAIQARCPADPGGRTWVASIEVSSVARRVRQRAPDARVEIEDRQGKRYRPCGGALSQGTERARSLGDEIGPEESFLVFLPFHLPSGAEPAGLVFHHGDVPGFAVIGADQSLLHPLALHRIALQSPR